MPTGIPPSADEVQRCVELLKRLHENSQDFAELTEEERVALLAAAGRFSRPSKDEIRIRNKNIDRARRKKISKLDRQARASTGIREARTHAVFSAPLQIAAEVKSDSERVLNSARNCYVCKAEFTKLHFFYDSMCPSCADFNYQKRFQTAPLHGRVALITGSRLKIGYQATLLMLRAGAKVIATTRFPVDSALRFAREADYPEWQDRLEIHGLDLRHTPSVEIFTRYIEQTQDRLDILINNAAQTVRRPPGFYAHMMPNENLALSDLPPEAQKLLRAHDDCKLQLTRLSTSATSADKALPVAWHGQAPGVGIRASAQLSMIPYSYDNSIAVEEVFPEGKLDADLQQVDLRTMNSWRMKLADVQIGRAHV